MITFASLFSGFGGADIGAINAGLTPIWGVEYDPKIAGVYTANLGDHLIVDSLLNVDPSNLERVDVLHASPPCPNFSQAKANAKETEFDIALAQKAADFIRILQPKIFTLENVYMYRKSQSWAIIRETLYACGYWLHFEHVNFADFGVPQTRKRMIVRAVKGGFVPHLPEAEEWKGWYQAVEDLVDELPDSEFVGWELARLPKQISENVLVLSGNKNYKDARLWKGVSREREPSNTVCTGGRKEPVRAHFIGEGCKMMSPRALSRIQSFPDSYKLFQNDDWNNACKGVGNAIPPLGYQKIISQLVEYAL